MSLERAQPHTRVAPKPIAPVRIEYMRTGAISRGRNGSPYTFSEKNTMSKRAPRTTPCSSTAFEARIPPP